MTLIIIAAFLAGFVASTIAHYLYYNDKINSIKKDARVAILEQAHESFGTGWMRCYKDEVTSKKRRGYDGTTILTTVSQ